MNVTRRHFLGTVSKVSVAGAVAGTTPLARGAETAPVSEDAMGVLVDLPQCIGCRKCEYACGETAGFDVPPMDTFEDKSVFTELRRPTPHEYTVVNECANPRDPSRPVYVKTNGFHCNDPACLSACLVGAFTKEADGSVTYDPWKCMGCRYCMVACPFQIPTYEYDNALTPQVRKCTFCFGRRDEHGGVPACVKICPNDALTFGKRTDLLALAREKIRARPDIYVDHIYGEYEVGGTAWLCFSPHGHRT